MAESEEGVVKQNYWIVGVVLVSLLAACSSEFRTCYTTRTCAPQGGSKGDAGSAGEAGADGGEGGSADGGGTMVAGAAGEMNGEGGTAGSAIAEGGAGGEGGTTTEDSRCGNGKIDHGETCDDGPNNGPGKACNAQCVRNICGDGDKGPGETCDDGANNRLGLLKCAPDCSRIINIKHVIFSPKSLPGTKLTPNPVAAADSTCPEGYKALFAYGTSRRATTAPFKSQDSIDWVLKPYTYYYIGAEKPVWLTDSVALLGVRNGQFSLFENTVDGTIAFVTTGLNTDYTTLESYNCRGWTSDEANTTRMGGFAGELGAEFIFKDIVPCGDESWFYCVEQ